MRNGTRLRDVVLILMLPFMALMLLIGPVWVASNLNQDTMITSCRLVDVNIRELQTLKQIATELGLPAEFDIPGRPAECAELFR